MDDKLAAMMKDFELAASGQSFRLRPRLPTIDALHERSAPGMTLHLQAGEENTLHRIAIRQYVLRADGVPITTAEANVLAADPTARGILRRWRNETITYVRDQGIVGLDCPRCGERHIGSLAEIAEIVDAPVPPIADFDDLLLFPELATPVPLPVQRELPPLPRAGLVPLALPSEVEKLERPYSAAILGAPLTPEVEHAAWQRWAKVGDVYRDSTRGDDTQFNPKYRARLRAALLILKLDEIDAPTPEQLVAMPMHDFAFIDAVYCLLYKQSLTTRSVIACQRCQLVFLVAR
ncbi:MAG TPA: hypothetical protein VGM88_26455 [Kofleriaceae bacterium]|jgi:hypothetical protein